MIKKYFPFLIVSLLAVLVGFVLGEKVRFSSSQVPFNEPVPMGGYGAIRGKVTEGAVTLVKAQSPSPASEIILLADASATTILQVAIPNDQGRFRFLVQSGQYLVGIGRSAIPIKDFMKVDMSNLQTKEITLTTMNP